jgi:hypothetical protein
MPERHVWPTGAAAVRPPRIVVTEGVSRAAATARGHLRRLPVLPRLSRGFAA